MAEDARDSPDGKRVVLGRYELLRTIARSNATVYEADDLRMGRRVAVKETRIPDDVSPERAEYLRARFLRQAVAAAALDHANIVTVYEAGAEGPYCYMVMELLRGPSLSTVLSRRGKLPIDEALEIITQVLDALQCAAEKGVVHRDIKPDNLTLEADGSVKVTDFDIAKREGEAGRGGKGPIGTPSYMSPEQARGRETDRRSDVYSAGVVLYEMVCGRKPFVGETVDEIIRALEYSDLEFPEHLPADLCWILRRALQRDPGARYGSAAEMLADIRAMQTRAPSDTVAATSPASPEVAAALGASERRFALGIRACLWSAVLVLAAVTIGGLALLSRPPGRPEAVPPAPAVSTPRRAAPGVFGPDSWGAQRRQPAHDPVGVE